MDELIVLNDSLLSSLFYSFFFFFQAEDGIRDLTVTGVQTCALPIWSRPRSATRMRASRLPPTSRVWFSCTVSVRVLRRVSSCDQASSGLGRARLWSTAPSLASSARRAARRPGLPSSARARACCRSSGGPAGVDSETAAADGAAASAGSPARPAPPAERE